MDVLRFPADHEFVGVEMGKKLGGWEKITV